MTKEAIEKLALEKYCSPYGKANPQTFAFIDGLTLAHDELEAARKEFEEYKSQINALYKVEVDANENVRRELAASKERIAELESGLREIENCYGDHDTVRGIVCKLTTN